jgi:hypothetical protein
MKVVHRSKQLLVIEDKPWLIGLLSIATALVFLYGAMSIISEGHILGALTMIVLGVGVPLLIGALMVQRVRLTFDRDAGSVVRTRRTYRSLTYQTYALDRLTGASVGVSTDSDGTSYRTELRLKDPTEIVPFTSYYTNGPKPEEMVDVVNDWLTAPLAPYSSATPDGNP